MTNLWRNDAPDDWRERIEAALKGTFVLERELRGGSSSRVFVGSETALGRRVVIKMLIPGVPTGEQEAEFRREAITAARLHHQHIVPIFTIGTVLGVPYYTMPFIDGESLRSRLDRAGALQIDEALRVLREIGSALGFAHELGVLHRDVKPENIVLERATGRALLGDFGIACALGDSRRATPAGMTVGTPVYMSPEQVDGLELDGRSDTYSLGLVAWEMLVGVRPWSGTSLDDVMYRQKHMALPPLDSYASAVPKHVVDAIERALCKKREDRWPSVGDFLNAIEPARRARPDPAHSSSRADNPSDAWATDRPWAESGEFSQAGADPAAVKTISMAARRDRGSASHATPAPMAERAAALREVRRREEAHERRQHRLRWTVAACSAAVVLSGLIAAMTAPDEIVRRWSTTLGDVIADKTRPIVPEDIRIDTMAMSDAAASLTSIAPVLPRDIGSDSLILAPLETPVRQLSGSSERPPTRLPDEGVKSYDAVRARAATATLSLQAYQAAVAGAAPLQSPPRTPISAEAVGNDTNNPAVGIRVRARRPPTGNASSSSTSQDTSPAVGVRVHAPRSP